jgi:hypothetical protein
MQITELQSSKYPPVTAKFGSEERIVQAYGFCQAWSMLFLHTLLLNNSDTVEDVTSAMEYQDMDDMALVIREYQSLIVDIKEGI